MDSFENLIKVITLSKKNIYKHTHTYKHSEHSHIAEDYLPLRQNFQLLGPVGYSRDMDFFTPQSRQRAGSEWPPLLPQCTIQLSFLHLPYYEKG